MTAANTSSKPRPLFRDFFRFKHVDWTWRRANELHEHGAHFIRNFDTRWIQRTTRYLRAQLGYSVAYSGVPPEDFSDIAAARKVHEEAGLFRDILQAFLLTKLSFAEISAKTGLAPAAVEAYEQVFFDVRTRLPHRGWIMTKAVGRPWLIGEGCTIGQVLRRLAYFAGDHILAQLVSYLQKHQSTSLSMPVGTVHLSDAEERSIRRCLALELLTLDNRNVVLLFGRHADTVREQPAGDQVAMDETTGQDWLEHVQFTGEGSNLAASLDPAWVAERTAVA